MSNANVLEALESALPDLSSSELKVIKAVCLAQREKNSERAGQVKLWTALYCLLDGETRRRKDSLERQELDYWGIAPPVIEWPGEQESDPNS